MSNTSTQNDFGVVVVNTYDVSGQCSFTPIQPQISLPETENKAPEIIQEDVGLLSAKTHMTICLASVLLLMIQIVQLQDPIGVDIIEILDVIICLILLSDFGYSLYQTSNRKAFLASRWWEALASIPIIDTANHGMLAVRLIRVLRLLRFFRLRRSLRTYLETSQRFLVRNRIYDMARIVSLTVLVGSLAFFYIEQGVNPNLHSYQDSFWWAMVTVTTIGYGDIYPVTTGGRLVAVAMMIIGIGCVSLFTGMIAGHVLNDNKCPHCNGDL